jgi:hypothetical protein
MSMKAIMWAFGLRGMSPGAKLAAIGVAECASGGVVDHRKVEWLARFVGVDVDRLFVYLDELTENCGVELRKLPDGGIEILAPALIPDTLERKATASDESPSFIYIIAGVEITKIGISSSPRERLYSLQLSFESPLKLIAAYAGPVWLIRLIERECHAILQPKKAFGEWYRVSPDEAIEIVRGRFDVHGRPI